MGKRECIMIKIRKTRGRDISQDVITYGWQTGLPGLYVTLDYASALDGLRRYGYTHIRSGMGFHCGALRCRQTAIQYAHKYFRVIDWTLDEKHITGQLGAVEMYKQSALDLSSE